MEEVKPDYEIELSEEITEEEMESLPEARKMKTAWYIVQDPEKKVIEIRPGSEGCISLNRAHDARFFIEILEKAIQEIF